MATKVALTAEEFRENSQRSIDLFNTEKLSTNSTHVLKSAYCNSVHFCRCNLHGACGGKGIRRGAPFLLLKVVAICTERVEAKEKIRSGISGETVAICTERVEAKFFRASVDYAFEVLQSARSVWRQSANHCARGKHSARCNLHGACRETERHHPPEKNPRKFMQTYCIFIHLGV